ncbi:hypothetical protein GS466_08960 [Rhodococcus hoagii]|nr:hypothetical protein [Prescottella equi]
MSGAMRVEPAELEVFARALRDLADQTSNAQSYLGRWLGLSPTSGGVFVEVVRAVEQTRERLTENYAHLGRLADGSAEALASAAEMYRTREASTTDSLASTMPGGR